MSPKSHSPRDVGDDEPDEPDEPRGGDRRGGEQRRQKKRSSSGAFRIDAEGGCCILSKREHIDLSCPVDQRSPGDEYARRQPRDATPGRIRRGAHHPPESAAHHIRLRSRERHHDRGIRERANDYAGYEQGPHIGARTPPAYARDCERDEDSANPAGERGKRDHGVARDAQ